MSRRVLLTLVPERREDIDHARRRIAYDHLVLATGPDRRPLAEAIANEENSTQGVQGPIARILDLAMHDPIAAHQSLTDEVRRARTDTVILNAGGGNAAQLVAMMMVAYHQGLETLFIQHGRIERLPILRGTTLPEWFPDDEAAILHALATDDAVATLDTRIGRGHTATHRSLRALTKKGLVQIHVRDGHAHGALTTTGRLVLQHTPTKRKE